MAAFPISVLGFGDNVVDKYEHIKTMYPGGNAVNFAVFAKKLGVERSAYMGIFGSDAEAEHVLRFGIGTKDAHVGAAFDAELLGKDGEVHGVAARVHSLDVLVFIDNVVSKTKHANGECCHG